MKEYIEPGIIIGILGYIVYELRSIRTNHLKGIYERLRKCEIDIAKICTKLKIKEED